ncbi:MAG: RNA polymerase sigma-70 factor [Bacteroidetes bacterium]|nr:RNA polymerase sigma-70 factor [Bacteroidota bacterium]
MQIDKHTLDKDLLNGIKLDNSKALKVLFERYYQTLCCFAFRYLKAADLAEEAVSDVFLNIWLKKRNIEIKTNIRAYLYAAVRNQSINYINQRKITHESIDSIEKNNIISELHADKLILNNELRNNIDILLKQLPEKRRIIFIMSRIDGFTYKEIAEILSISVNTVQNQMVEAVKFLSKKSLNSF